MLGLNARTARVAWTVAVIAIGLCAVYFMRKTLFIFAIALFIAYMMAPLVRRLERRRPRRMPKVTSVAAAFVIMAAIVVTISAWLGPRVTVRASETRFGRFRWHAPRETAIRLAGGGAFRAPPTRPIQSSAQRRQDRSESVDCLRALRQ